MRRAGAGDPASVRDIAASRAATTGGERMFTSESQPRQAAGERVDVGQATRQASSRKRVPSAAAASSNVSAPKPATGRRASGCRWRQSPATSVTATTAASTMSSEAQNAAYERVTTASARWCHRSQPP